MRTRRRTEEDGKLTRRAVLSRTVGAAAAIGGLGVFPGTASAWQRFDVVFEACGKVRLVVGEKDLQFDPPLIADVIVASWGETTCRRVEFTADTATTSHDACVDGPVVTYEASGPEKILGVVHYTPSRKPACLTVNDHECADLAIVPDADAADCVPADLERCDQTQKTQCIEDSSGESLGGHVV